MSTGWRTITGQQFERLTDYNIEIITKYKAYGLESVMMVMIMTNHQRL
jgi:hypothetical protein